MTETGNATEERKRKTENTHRHKERRQIYTNESLETEARKDKKTVRKVRQIDSL